MVEPPERSRAGPDFTTAGDPTLTSTAPDGGQFHRRQRTQLDRYLTPVEPGEWIIACG